MFSLYFWLTTQFERSCAVKHVYRDRSQELSTPSLASFSPCLRKQRRTKQDDEGQSNHHGAVDIIKSEQQICKSAAITLVVRNFWSRTSSATGSYGRLAGRLTKYR